MPPSRSAGASGPRPRWCCASPSRRSGRWKGSGYSFPEMSIMIQCAGSRAFESITRKGDNYELKWLDGPYAGETSLSIPVLRPVSSKSSRTRSTMAAWNRPRGPRRRTYWRRKPPGLTYANNVTYTLFEGRQHTGKQPRQCKNLLERWPLYPLPSASRFLPIDLPEGSVNLPWP